MESRFLAFLLIQTSFGEGRNEQTSVLMFISRVRKEGCNI